MGLEVVGLACGMGIENGFLQPLVGFSTEILESKKNTPDSGPAIPLRPQGDIECAKWPEV
jgi:hypothetical protein